MVGVAIAALAVIAHMLEAHGRAYRVLHAEDTRDADGDGRREIAFAESGATPRIGLLSAAGRILPGFPRAAATKLAELTKEETSPEIGSQPRWTPNRIMRSSASQNVGTANPVNTVTVEIRSNQESFRTAE